MLLSGARGLSCAGVGPRPFGRSHWTGRRPLGGDGDPQLPRLLRHLPSVVAPHSVIPFVGLSELSDLHFRTYVAIQAPGRARAPLISSVACAHALSGSGAGIVAPPAALISAARGAPD